MPTRFLWHQAALPAIFALHLPSSFTPVDNRLEANRLPFVPSLSLLLLSSGRRRILAQLLLVKFITCAQSCKLTLMLIQHSDLGEKVYSVAPVPIRVHDRIPPSPFPVLMQSPIPPAARSNTSHLSPLPRNRQPGHWQPGDHRVISRPGYSYQAPLPLRHSQSPRLPSVAQVGWTPSHRHHRQYI